MNFFDAQERARRSTRRLIVAYIAATLLIIAGVTALVAVALYSNMQSPDPAVLIFAALCTALLIVGATLYKTARLSSGGGRVARDLGGTLVSPDVSDPLRRRLRNVVEEMAIASGVPVPEIYVLEQEAGINAFAAGFTPGDAAIAVTRGTLEILSRDELQGVVAHEFSHILNGDMRLNIRMMGVLFGIMVLGLIGRLILRGSYRGRIVSSRRGRGSGTGAVLIIGLGLVVIGSVGVLMSRLVKAAVSRQREFLADASAVQFTRQTDGIADALKKIAGYQQQSYLQATDPEEVSHMLFAHGSKFTSLFATHPPLLARIQALQPQFSAESLQAVTMPVTPQAIDEGSDARAAGFAGAAEATPGSAITDTIGNPTLQHVLFAGALRIAIPDSLYGAAHSVDSAMLLTLALFINRDGETSPNAFDVLEQQLGEQRTALIRRYHDELAGGSAQWRLPLLEIAFPTLRQLPVQRLEYLLDLSRRLIELDGQVALHEFCLFRILKLNLGDALAPATRSKHRASRSDVRVAALELVAIVAHAGNLTEADRQQAFQTGISVFGDWAADAPYRPPENPVQATGRSLDVLQHMNNAARQSMVQALAAAISSDRQLNVSEAELLRTVCASLDCPLPPLDVERHIDTP
ncbi:MAG: M48 family metallopeptidase [Woeseia sp.]